MALYLSYAMLARPLQPLPSSKTPIMPHAGANLPLWTTILPCLWFWLPSHDTFPSLFTSQFCATIVLIQSTVAADHFKISAGQITSSTLSLSTLENIETAEKNHLASLFKLCGFVSLRFSSRFWGRFSLCSWKSLLFLACLRARLLTLAGRDCLLFGNLMGIERLRLFFWTLSSTHPFPLPSNS